MRTSSQKLLTIRLQLKIPTQKEQPPPQPQPKMAKIKYITENVTINTVKNAGDMYEIVTNKLPSEWKRVTGIAFFEAANANDLDYELRVSDNAEMHQDFTTKYDFLSIIKGVNIKNVPFDQYYKPYSMPAAGNKVLISIKHITAVGVGQSISLKVVIRVEKD